MIIIGALCLSTDIAEVVGGVRQWLLPPSIRDTTAIDGLRTINGFLFLLPHTTLYQVWIEN